MIALRHDVHDRDQGWFFDWRTGEITPGLVVKVRHTSAGRAKVVSVLTGGLTIKNMRRSTSPAADEQLPAFALFSDRFPAGGGWRGFRFFVGIPPHAPCPECKGAIFLAWRGRDCRICQIPHTLNRIGLDLRGLRHR